MHVNKNRGLIRNGDYIAVHLITCTHLQTSTFKWQTVSMSSLEAPLARSCATYRRGRIIFWGSDRVNVGVDDGGVPTHNLTPRNASL